MKHTHEDERHTQILTTLSHLPRKMVLLHGDEKVAAFVLYELCQKQCFNFERAAYFVDNSDFNCLKGVAGCCRQELPAAHDIWQSAGNFSRALTQSPFHTNVVNVAHTSIKHGGKGEKEAAEALAHMLGIKNPSHCCWNMKHDNHGLLVFEKASHADMSSDDHLVNGLSLLSFCPII